MGRSSAASKTGYAALVIAIICCGLAVLFFILGYLSAGVWDSSTAVMFGILTFTLISVGLVLSSTGLVLALYAHYRVGDSTNGTVTAAVTNLLLVLFFFGLSALAALPGPG